MSPMSALNEVTAPLMPHLMPAPILLGLGVSVALLGWASQPGLALTMDVYLASNRPAHFGSLWLISGGMLTMAFGAIGMLGSQRLGYLAEFGAIVSSVSLLAAAEFGQPLLTAGLLYYLPSSTLAISALFLLAGLLAVAIPLLTAGLRPAPVRIRRPAGRCACCSR